MSERVLNESGISVAPPSRLATGASVSLPAPPTQLTNQTHQRWPDIPDMGSQPNEEIVSHGVESDGKSSKSNKSNGSDTSKNDTNTSGTDNDNDEHINDNHNKSEDGPDTSAFFFLIIYPETILIYLLFRYLKIYKWW